MRKKYSLVIWGVFLGIVSWFVESAMHFLVFEETLIEALWPPFIHEIWMRLLLVVLFIVFGIYAQVIVGRRQAAEEKIQLAYTELNQIFETAADGMRVIDKNFNVARINKTLVDMSGASKANAIGRKCYETFRGAACETDICPLVRILAGEERVEYEVEKERIDGGKIHCIVAAMPFRDARGNIIGIVEDFKDITARKQWEDALRKSEAAIRDSESKLKALIEYSPDAIFMKSIKGEFIFLNKKAEGVLSLKKEGVLPPELAESITVDDLNIIKTKKSMVLQEEVRLASRREKTILEISKYPILDADGEVVYICIVCRDISETKKMERMKDNLIRDISHELKTPIAMAEMAYEMSERGIKRENMEQIKKAHRIAIDNIKRLRRDVDNVLDIFMLSREKLIAKEKEEISLAGIINEVNQDVKYELKEKALKFNVDIAEGADKLWANRRRIKTLLYNVIDNAIKFTEKGEIKMLVKSCGNRICLRIKDTGCGIARENIGKVFNMLYQRHAVIPGTGLGLTICREIVNMYKGKIKVCSKGVDQGTVVFISLLKVGG
jgi:PAS domain S-box-containing protein